MRGLADLSRVLQSVLWYRVICRLPVVWTTKGTGSAKKRVGSCGSTGPTDLEMAGGRQEGARRVAVPTEQITRKKERRLAEHRFD